MSDDSLKYNGHGYRDMTAYLAIRSAIHAELVRRKRGKDVGTDGGALVDTRRRAAGHDVRDSGAAVLHPGCDREAET